jgi:hypothetical protein
VKTWVVIPAGLEPATRGVEIRYSNFVQDSTTPAVEPRVGLYVRQVFWFEPRQVFGAEEGPPSQGQRSFAIMRMGIVAMDLFAPIISLQLLYGLLIMGHGRRQIRG